jgi:beta-lactamase regulating signal transducer with metallopeptidase domain
MSSLFEGIGHAVAQFAWQGLVLWGVTAACLRALRGADPRQRYLVSIGALAAGLGLFLVSILEGASLALELDAGAGPGSVPALAGLVDSTVPAAGPHPWQAPLAWAWTLGACLMGLRLLAGLHVARGLRARALRVQEPAWLDLVAQLARQLGIRGSIELLESSGVTSPAVIGWWRPVLLVPASMLTGLSHEHVRAVLAHELAHIRRWDPLFNAALAVTQVLLFFHPFTWWLVRTARAECEHCCDDLAISLLPSPRLLAEALTRLEAQRLTSDLALSARPKESPLMLRIQRILAPSRRPSPLAGRVASVAAALLVGAALTGADPFLPGTTAAAEPAQETDDEKLQGGRKAALEARYAQAVARYEAGVKAGKLSAEEAKLKLAELRREMFGDGDKTRDTSDMEASRRKYAELEREIKAAVAAGKLSAEDAERKLIELREEMFGDRAKAKDAADMEARRRKYAELEREIKAAVAAGKLSAEDAERKLIELRKEMFGEPADAGRKREKGSGSGEREKKRRRVEDV